MEGSYSNGRLQMVAVALLVLLQLSAPAASSNPSYDSDIEYIKTSCGATTYRRLCYHSLSIYATKIKSDPKSLTNTALNITLRATKSTSRMLVKLLSRTRVPRETAGAIADCVEVIGDSIDEFQDSIDELGHIRNSNFYLTMGDVQTWVSAALTDEDTCMDGLQGKPLALDGYTKAMIRRHVLKVAHLTSNALALINSYASTSSVP